MGFRTALAFLTILPLPRGEITPRALGRAVGFFPLVGVLLGSGLALVAWGTAHLFPPNVAAALTLAAWVGSTGALHLDGFLDACDGLLGGHTPETRLHIMRDERIGAFAFAGGLLLLLTKYAALSHLLTTTSWSPLRPALAPWILAPTLGRFAMSHAVLLYPYARAQGLGRAMKDHAGWKEGLLAGSVTLGAILALSGPLGLLRLILVVGTTVLLARWVLHRIPGLTGDVYGAICELTETIVLLTFIAQSPGGMG